MAELPVLTFIIGGNRFNLALMSVISWPLGVILGVDKRPCGAE